MEVFRRTDDLDAWTLDVLEERDNVELRSLDVSFSVDELYSAAGL